MPRASPRASPWACALRAPRWRRRSIRATTAPPSGAAAWRALAAEDAAGNAERTGAYLREKLAALPQVEEVRGLGLMVACDLAEGVSAPDVVLAGLDEGLLLNFTGPRTLRFLPPLVCSKEDVDVLVQKLAALLS